MSARAFSLVEDQWAETTSVNQWVFKHSHWWRISGRRLQSIDECSSILIGGGSVGGDYISQSMSVQAFSLVEDQWAETTVNRWVFSLVEDQWAETTSVNRWVFKCSHWWRISGRRLYQSINEWSSVLIGGGSVGGDYSQSMSARG